MAKTPEQSKHTSVKRRCEAATSEGRVTGVLNKQPKQLQRFAGNPRLNMPDGLPFRLTDYLELLDWTGRQKTKWTPILISEKSDSSRINFSPFL